MTALDVTFHYAVPPGERTMQAIAAMREVYGIRALRFDEKNRTVRVEFDASRLNEEIVESLLRRAGIDLAGKAALA